MKVLLLGASGFLGHNVLIRLLEEGHEVVMVNRREGAVQIEKGRWEIVVGDPLDEQVLQKAGEGCDAVVNCAGATDMSMIKKEDFESVNVELVKRVVHVMEERGIKKMVHISTVNTIGYGSEEEWATESREMKSPFKGSLYADSKKRGEEVAIRSAAYHSDWHVVLLNPGYMIGGWDIKPSSGKLLLAAWKLPIAFSTGGGKAFVAVRDVADATVSALERGRSGERYIVTNAKGCISIKELYEMQAKVGGYRQIVITLPKWVMRSVGKIGDGLRGMGVRTAVSDLHVEQLRVREYYDNSHGLCELGYSQTPLEDAVREFYDWRNNKRKI